jgi:hypothetical protein
VLAPKKVKEKDFDSGFNILTGILDLRLRSSNRYKSNGKFNTESFTSRER